jgi:hypothetical protein
MAETAGPFGAPREILMDGRGTALRLSWHRDQARAVLSLWREDRCIATFQASPDDLARIISYLAAVLAGAVAKPSRWLSDTAYTAPLRFEQRPSVLRAVSSRQGLSRLVPTGTDE